MRNLLNILFIAALAAAWATAEARTVRDFFLSEQGGIFNTLPTSKRQDMLAYYDAGRLMPTENSTGDTATLSLVTDAFLSITTSSVSDVQMAMLVTKKDTTILVVNTLRLPASDSRITAYDTGWNQVDIGKVVELPSLEDFVTLPEGSKMKKSEVTGQIRFPLISYTVDPSTMAITARQHLADFISEEEWEELAPYFLDSLSCPLKLKLANR